MRLSEIANQLGITETETTTLLRDAGYKASEINEDDIPELRDLVQAAIQKSNNTLTVTTAKETDPDTQAGIVPSQPTGMSAGLPNPMFQSVEQVVQYSQPINYSSGSQGQNLSVQAQIASQQHLLNRLQQIHESATAYTLAERQAAEAELSMVLYVNRLDPSGTLQEKTERWQKFVADKEASYQESVRILEALNQQNAQILAGIPGMAGRH